MNVVLLSPPSPFLIDQKSFPPLGILYLAAILKRHGISVAVADLANQEGRLEEALAVYDGADLYGITSTTPQYPQALRILVNLRRHNPKATIIIGGAHPSSLPEQCLADGFDHVIVGEGEQALLEMCKQGAGPDGPSIITSQPIDNIDDIPYPARHLIDIQSFAYDIDGGRGTTLITSRGCPFSCAFCSKDVWQGGPRFHSVPYVIDELRQLIDQDGFRHFLFLDDSLTLRKSRLFELCRQMEPLDIHWRCYARAGTTREMLLAMKKAGCVEVGIGVESGSQGILNRVNKGSTVEQNARFVELCREVGMMANVFIMIGLPGETYETVEETRRWMERVRPHKFGFNIFMPYAGTPVYQDPEKYGIRIFDVPPEKSWVKGRQGEYEAFIETEALKREEIVRLFYDLFGYFTELTKWQPGVGKNYGK